MLETLTTVNQEESQAQVAKFDKQVKDLLSQCKITSKDLIVAERMMARPGQGGGSVNELINIMLGILLSNALQLGIPMQLVMSSTWKNHAIDKWGLIQGMPLSFYFPELEKDKEVHELDACGIAAYTFEKLSGREVFWSCLN
jgi:hypothetical protein